MYKRQHYIDAVHALGAELSVSSSLATVPEAVEALAAASGDTAPSRSDEPYRRALSGIYARPVSYTHLDVYKRQTFDHVVPRRLGGRTSWENVTTACAPCNLRKGGRTPAQAHMPLHQKPWRPTSWQLQDNGRAFPPGYLHESWIDWLYWDVELEG